ncbi:MAG TPA: DedA family protein [Candidatus Limnocylindria bacterium]|nr:DedA family protein [Candidatus Limnocylindria bacterium]
MLEAIDAVVIPFLEALYERFGYVGVVIAMAIESAAIPLPSELILPFAGWSVSKGLTEPLTSSPWSYWGAVIAGVVGNTVGSLASYAIGAYGGRPLVERYGKYVLISAHDLELADRWFARYGEATVFFSRMLPIVRTFISVPAGIARMPLWRFTLFSILGAIPWVMLLVWGGMQLGDHWLELKHNLRGLDYLIAAAILLGVGLFIWRHVRRR